MTGAEQDDADRGLEDFLRFLRETRSLDLTGYKRPSLSRRIRKRIDAVGVATFEEYEDYLETHPDEQSKLVDTVLINVTSFFRDEGAWTYLYDHLVPAIVDGKQGDEPIRIWSAGCASGEEAYSLAIAFADHMGMPEFRSRVKIFATDNDEDALATARRGVYSARVLEPLPDSIRDRCFERTGDDWVIRPDYRRQVIFGRNDLTKDAPISRLDLLVCRNVLMYFVGAVQQQVLARFHHALNDGGFLLLGRAETVTTRSDLFEPVESSHRVFVRRPGGFAPRGRTDAVGGRMLATEYADVTDFVPTRVDLEHAGRDLEIANQHLVAANEELATTNEELQSTNEELETTNEELQSANEELETINEELQSANEELETMNEEFVAQTRQYEAGQRLLSSVLASLPGGVVVVDERLDVVMWNRTAEELFGLREDEVSGRSLLALDVGLPAEEIAPILRETAVGEPDRPTYVKLDAVNRWGQPIPCRVGVRRLPRATHPIANVLVWIEATPQDSS